MNTDSFLYYDIPLAILAILCLFAIFVIIKQAYAYDPHDDYEQLP